MALIPKVYAPTPAQATAAARALKPSHVASLDGQISDAATGAATSNLDSAPFTLQGDTHYDNAQQQDRERPPPRHGGLLAVNSQTFGSLVEYQSELVANDAGPEARSRRIGGIVSHAISTYETNAKIIHGEPDVTGRELSMRL